MTKRPPVPDARLRAAMALCGPCEAFADIGADHGRLSAAMLLSGQAKRALVADVSEKALSRARALLDVHELTDRAVFRVANGLDALDALPRVDAVFMLGMGGDTISGILMRGRQRLQGARLILGAQTELPLLRDAVCNVGYRVRRETLSTVGSYTYLLMLCEPALPGEPPHTPAECRLGPALLRDMPREWLPVLRRRERLLTRGVISMAAAASEKDGERLSRFRVELADVRACLAQMKELYGEGEGS